jgi:hypothetical protein
MGTREALAEINSTFRRCLESAEHRERVAEVYEGIKNRGQKSEVGSQTSDVRSQKSDVRSQRSVFCFSRNETF